MTRRPHVSSEVRNKSHGELKGSSSIGRGTHKPSDPRGDGNIKLL